MFCNFSNLFERGIFKGMFFFSKGERNGLVVLCSLIVLMFAVNFCLPLQSKEERQIVEFIENDTSPKPWETHNGSANKSSYRARKEEKSYGKIAKGESKKDGIGLMAQSEENKSGGLFHPKNHYDGKNSVDNCGIDCDGAVISVKHSPFRYDGSSDRLSNIKNIKGRKPKVNYDTVRVELNSADTTELKRLRGVGSVLSARIVKYRKIIGGFKTVEQLEKIYGLPEETYQSIKSHVYIK